MTRPVLAVFLAAGTLPWIAHVVPPPPLALEAQAPAFRSGAQAVQVDVLVTDRGRPVPGLTAADFELFDNGVRQEVALVQFDQLPLRVVLAFDMSASVTSAKLGHLRRAATALLEGLSGRDRAGLITFSDAVVEAQALTNDVSKLRDALSRLQPNGGTALVDGAYAAMTAAEAEAGRSLLIIFSDGVDTASWLTPGAVVETGRRSDVVVYSVASGSQRPTFLRELSDATGGQSIENESTETLEQRFLDVLDEFRRRYVLVYTPTDVDEGGWHRLDVRVKGRRVRVTARPGYMAGTPAPGSRLSQLLVCDSSLVAERPGPDHVAKPKRSPERQQSEQRGSWSSWFPLFALFPLW